VVLDHGQVAFRGSAADGVNAYVRSLADRSADGDLSRLPRHGAGGVRLNELRLRRGKELITRHICGDPLEIALRYQVAEELVVSDLSLQVRLQDENGATVLTLWNKSVERDRPEYPRGGWASFLIQRLPLRPGVYKLSMWVKSHRGIEDWLDHTLDFEVIDGDFFGTGRMPPKDTGPVLVDHVFRVLPELDVL
jgi:lipopolysaccharide transport system ATP-binding protein